jgi:tetratricopeptide (TPR) repeat protein
MGALIPVAKAILPILGFVMLWRGLPLLPSEYCAELARRSLRDKDPMDAVKYAQMGLGPASGTAAAASSAAAADPKKPDLLSTLLSKTGPDPKDPDLYFYLGEANRQIAAQMLNPYIRRRYYGLADAAYKGGLKIFPQDENLLARDAQALDGTGNFAAAEPVYREALAADPNLEVIQWFYEAHLTAEGKPAEAEAMARQRERNKAAVVDSDQAADNPLR